MTETMSNPPTTQALTLAAEHLNVELSQLSVYPVTGGYSLNRRAIAGADGVYVFVKEVDDTLVDGDGELERGWLAKDYGLITSLREKGSLLVPEWSELSEDGTVLLLPAYRPEDGWIWDLPEDGETQQRYITAVLDAEAQLEGVNFTDTETESLSLAPYFRQKIAQDGQLPVLDSTDNLSRITEKCDTLLGFQQDDHIVSGLEGIKAFLKDAHQQTKLKKVAQQLEQQPDEVFGHCDLRTDNLAYHVLTGKIILVDWNWASYTPKGFGATEFLINIEKKGVDVSQWSRRFNWPLAAALVGFWLRGCTQPNLGDTSKLRDEQLISAGLTLDLLNRNGHL